MAPTTCVSLKTILELAREHGVSRVYTSGLGLGNVCVHFNPPQPPLYCVAPDGDRAAVLAVRLADPMLRELLTEGVFDEDS